MTITSERHPAFSAASPVDEPIEIRLTRPRLDLSNGPWVLTCSVTSSGMILESLVRGSGGCGHSLSYLSNRVFPQKAVAGWQAEVIAWMTECLDKHGPNEMVIR